MLARLKFDIEDLANEMVNQLPEDVFISPTTTFYDPSMGGGQFILAIINKLRKYHSDENIEQRIFGTEGNIIRINYIKNKYRNKILGNFTDKIISDMKFDVIIGNPPFADSTNALWADFIVKSFDILNNKGILSFITPNKWAGLTDNKSSFVKGRFGVWRDYFKDNITYFNIGECSKHFPVGAHSKDMFSYFVLDKSRNNKEVGFRDTFEDNSIPFEIIKNLDYIPLRFMGNVSLTFSILHKFNSDTSQRIKFSETKNYKLEKNNKLIIPVGRRVGIDKFNMFVDNDINEDEPNIKCHVSKVGVAKATKKTITSLFKSKLYKFIFEIYFDYDFVPSRFFTLLPVLDLSKVWSDEEIYSHFNLTQEEIDLIEKTIQ